eukprot:22910_5
MCWSGSIVCVAGLAHILFLLLVWRRCWQWHCILLLVPVRKSLLGLLSHIQWQLVFLSKPLCIEF